MKRPVWQTRPIEWAIDLNGETVGWVTEMYNVGLRWEWTASESGAASMSRRASTKADAVRALKRAALEFRRDRP